MKHQRFAQVYGIEHEGRVVYVGVTMVDIRQRLSKHYEVARNGRRGTKKLGPWLLTNPKITVKIIELCTIESRFERESFWINHFNTIENGFNALPAGGPGRPKGCENPTGKDHYLYGKPVAKHIVAASVAARIGKPLSEEHRKKQSEGHARRLESLPPSIRRSDGLEFKTIKLAGESIGVTGGAIVRALKYGTPSGGYKWERI